MSLLMMIMSNRWPHRASMSRAVAIISFSSSSCGNRSKSGKTSVNTKFKTVKNIPYRVHQPVFASGEASPNLAVPPGQCKVSDPKTAGASDFEDGD